jgi:hypothetical protein
VKKQTAEFIDRCVNVTQDEFIVGREKMGSVDLYVLGIPGREKPLYTLIDYKKERNKYKIRNGSVESTETVKIERTPPKGTGGEPAYAMLMLTEMGEHELSLDASGLLMKFILYNLEWNTGRLIRKRDKKPLTRGMISDQYGIGKQRLKKLLSEMSDIVEYSSKSKAYYIKRKYVKKGMGE